MMRSDAGMWRHCFTKLHIVCCCGCTTCHLLWHCCWWHLLWCDVFANDSECNEIPLQMPTTFIQFFWIAITISLWMVARAPGKTCALWVRMSMGERGKCRQHSIHFFFGLRWRLVSGRRRNYQGPLWTNVFPLPVLWPASSRATGATYVAMCLKPIAPQTSCLIRNLRSSFVCDLMLEATNYRTTPPPCHYRNY